MVALSDEQRFKNLPTTQEWIKFRDTVTNNSGRVIIIQETYWHNALTRCKGKVLDMPILAANDDSNRAMAVTHIKHFIKTPVMRKEIDSETGEEREVFKSYDYTYDDEKTWTFNKDYAHTNITTSITDIKFLYDDEEDDKIKHGYHVFGHDICCPITRHHFYYKDLTELALLFKGQLMGQNSGSPFRRVESVANNYNDKVLRDSHGAFIKRTAPIIQLLSKMTLNDIATSDRLHDIMGNLRLPTDENEIMVKRIEDHEYITIKKEELPALEERGEISAYYPILDYELTKNILDNIPKIKVDMGVMGLGSASTGILDQVIRSTFFEKYLLCDFDYVEEKNLRNQWYIRNHIGNSKVQASRTQIGCIKSMSEVELIQKACKFQEANLPAYEFKYLVSGFDSIDCRLELLDYVTENKTKAQFIIDTRYDDLDSSIFIIDTSNQAEMEYYRQGLLSDKEAFDEQAKKNMVQTLDEFYEWLDKNNIFVSGCPSFHNKLFNTMDFRADLYEVCGNECGTEKCKEYFKTLWEDERKREIISTNCTKNPPQENSCLRQNFIDIYKFSSSFVFAAIRAIEAEEPKPFTHVEATTNGLPRYMVLRK